MFNDVLIENPNGEMGYANVLGGPRPGLLSTIATINTATSTLAGLATTITYKDLPSLSRQASSNNAPWTLQSPQSIHVVTDVLVVDATPGLAQVSPPIVPSVETQYTYTNPVYDGRDQEFVGFQTVEVINVGDSTEPSMHTKTTFYQGYCNNGTAQYPCPTTADYPNHALRGLPILTEIYGDQTSGNTGAALSTTHRRYKEVPLYDGMDGRGVHRVALNATDTYTYDNSQPVVRSAANSLLDILSYSTVIVQPDLQFYMPSTYKHTYSFHADGDSWGMSGTEYDNGVVDSSQDSTDGQIVQSVAMSPVAQDTVDNWIWRPSSSSIYGTPPSSSQTMGARTLSYSYDTRGNLKSVQSLLTGEERMVRSSATMPETADGGASAPPGAPSSASVNNTNVTLRVYTPDPSGTGNVNRVQQPGTSGCTDIAYDALYSLLPVGTTTYLNGCGTAGLSSVVTAAAFGLGLVEESSTPDGQVTKIQYDPFGRPQQIFRPDLTAPGFPESLPGVTIDYGDTSMPRQVHTTVTDNAGNTLNSWSVLDGYGRSVLKVTPGDKTAGDSQPYIFSGQVLVNARGAVHALFPASPSPTAFTGTMTSLNSRNARTVAYDAFGRVTFAADIGGTQTLQRTYYPLGSYAEEDADQILSGGAPLSNSHIVEFDGHGRAVSDSSFAGTYIAMTQVTYLPTGEPWIIDRSGTDPTSNSYRYERWMQYDSLGRMVLNAEPSSSTGFYLASSNMAAGPQPPLASLQAWTYAYDDAGNLVATTDARGCGKNIAYDAAARPLYEDYVGCTANQPGYSPPNPATGEGTEVFYQYDPQGRLSVEYDRASYTGYSYDGRSRFTGITRHIAQPNAIPSPSGTGYAPTGFVQEFTYDDFDRLTGQTTGEDGGPATLLGTPLSLSSETSGSAITSSTAITLQYSQRGLVKSVGGSYGSLIQLATYEPSGQPHTTTWGDLASTMTTMTYDARLRPYERASTRAAPSLWTSAGSSGYEPPTPGTSAPTTPTVLEDDTYTLDPASNLTNIEDNRGQTASLIAEWPTIAQPVNRAIGYDPLYRMNSVTYTYPGSNAYSSPTPAETATEDPFPLTAATARIGKESIVYDPFGNRLTTTDDVGRFFDRSLSTITTGVSSSGSTTNQVTSAGDGSGGNVVTTNYDAAGNLVRLNVLRSANCESSVGCNQLFDYEWDEVGHLSRARRYDFAGGKICHTVNLGSFGGVQTICTNNPLPTSYPFLTLPTTNPDADVQFVYDSAGVRVLRASSTYGSADGTNTAYTVNIFPSLRLADTTFGQTNTTGDYDRSENTDEVSLVAAGQAFGRVVYAPADPMVLSSTVAAGTHVFLELTDHLGSTSTVIDQATSELVERTTYSAFGRVESDYRPARWNNFREPFKFTGKEDDIAIGITYFAARYYSPYLGTWISADPLTIHTLGADMNPYAYVRGRTMSATDPLGLDCSENNSCQANWAYLISPVPIPWVVNSVGSWLSGFHIGGGGGPAAPPAAPQNPGNRVDANQFWAPYSRPMPPPNPPWASPPGVVDNRPSWFDRPTIPGLGDKIGSTGGKIILALGLQYLVGTTWATQGAAAGVVTEGADAAAVLQELVATHRAALAADPALAAQYLTEAEQVAGPSLNAANFGKALERAVAEDVEANHADVLQYVGGPNSPDFVGVGPAAGRTFDITTYLQQAPHYARPYGGSLELILYETPSAWP